MLAPEAVRVHPTQPSNQGVRLGYRGSKDNRRGLGAVVEIRSGPIYRRIYWRGEAELVGVGEGTEMDLVRVTWPNGVVQYDDRRDLGDRAATDDALGFLQSEGLQGSCPFLYTWNGETFEFISDVLGITPLGLPIAPGVLVPPDHDEYVLVLGEQLRPNGRLPGAAVHRGAARGHLPRPTSARRRSTTRSAPRSSPTSASPSRRSPRRTRTPCARPWRRLARYRRRRARLGRRAGRDRRRPRGALRPGPERPGPGPRRRRTSSSSPSTPRPSSTRRACGS